jgi:REP element-mobilizing transposase RayT
MTSDPSPRHKPLRLAGYDYAQAGTYAVTVVVRGRRCYLGVVEDYEFRPALAGDIVRDVWERLPNRFPTIQLDAFVVLPNHIHGIVLLGANPFVADQVAINGDTTQPVPLVAPPFMAASQAEHQLLGPRPQALKPPSRDPNAPALGEIIRSLKAASTTRIRKECLPDFAWQERYWDRIVRNEAELDRYRGYIATNPERWTFDREYADQ